MRVLLGKTSLRWHVAAASLLLSNVVLVCQSLLFLEALRHVSWMHVRYLWGYVATVLLLGKVLRGRLLG